MKPIPLAFAAAVLGLIAAIIWFPAGRLIAVIALIMLVVGTTVALLWWRLADSMFPGASRATGQEIRLGRAAPGHPRADGARVIRDFGDGPGPSAR